jgi:hypothetical protein
MSILITLHDLEQGKRCISEPGPHLLIGRIVIVTAMMGIFVERPLLVLETMAERRQSQLAGPQMAWSAAWKSDSAVTINGLRLQKLGQ